MYEKFSELLQRKNVKAADVSRGTGIKQTVFSEWKKGKSTPKIDKLQKIADYFGVSIDYFIGEENDDKNSTPADEISKSAPEWIDKLSDTELVKVDEYAKFLISQRSGDK